MLDVDALVAIERHGDDVFTLALRRPPDNALLGPIPGGTQRLPRLVGRARALDIIEKRPPRFA